MFSKPIFLACTIILALFTPHAASEAATPYSALIPFTSFSAANRTYALLFTQKIEDLGTCTHGRKNKAPLHFYEDIVRRCRPWRDCRR